MTGTETYQRVSTGWLSLRTGTIVPYGGSTPPPPSGKYIGVYMSGNNAGLNAYTASWPTQPNLASFYMSWNTTVASVPLISTYAAAGRLVFVELATKISSGTYVLWTDITAGTYDAHIISFITALNALGVRTMMSLDNEADIKATSGTGEVAPGQTAAQYVAAANHVYDLIAAHSTHVESMVWLAGGTASTAQNFLPAKAKLQNVGWDPYKTGTHKTDTPTTLFNNFITGVLVPKGYDDYTVIKRHINETGIVVGTLSDGTNFSSATQIAWHQGIPAGMAANFIESVIWFRANSGAHPYIPTDPTVDDAFRDMVDAAIG